MELAKSHDFSKTKKHCYIEPRLRIIFFLILVVCCKRALICELMNQCLKYLVSLSTKAC